MPLAVGFEFLFRPLEGVDAWLTGLLDGAPLLVALAIAFALGLRHASDPDHLVAVTSLVAADGGDTRGAARLGAWWGAGHAAILLVIGLIANLAAQIIVRRFDPLRGARA
jgi:high-affinity nickel permease